MSLKRTLDRNRQMKKIAQGVIQKWEKATIYSIDGDRANIRLGSSPNLIRHCEVSGDASALSAGQIVPILWKDKRPLVVQKASSIASTNFPASLTTDIEMLKIHMSTTVSVANTAAVLLTFDTVLIDTGGYFDPATPDQVTVWADGLYLVIGDISWASVSTYLRRTRILVNDDEAARGGGVGSGSGAVDPQCSTTLMLRKGDKVQLEAYQNSGGAVSTAAFANSSPFLMLMRLK